MSKKTYEKNQQILDKFIGVICLINYCHTCASYGNLVWSLYQNVCHNNHKQTTKMLKCFKCILYIISSYFVFGCDPELSSEKHTVQTLSPACYWRCATFFVPLSLCSSGDHYRPVWDTLYWTATVGGSIKIVTSPTGVCHIM